MTEAVSERCRTLVLGRRPSSTSAVGRLAAGALLLTVVGSAVGLVIHELSPVALDERLLTALADRRSPAMTELMSAVTTAGDLWVVALVVVLAAPLLRRLTGSSAVVWLLGAALLGTLAITGVIKTVVARERPVDALAGASTDAFPSGHTSRAAAMFGLGLWLVMALSKAPTLRAVLGLVSVAGIASMALSRVYLGVHWPTDVLFGTVVGLGWVAVVLWAVEARSAPTAEADPAGRPDASDDR